MFAGLELTFDNHIISSFDSTVYLYYVQTQWLYKRVTQATCGNVLGCWCGHNLQSKSKPVLDQPRGGVYSTSHITLADLNIILLATHVSWIYMYMCMSTSGINIGYFCLEYSCNKYSNLIDQLEVHYFTCTMVVTF